VNPNVVTAKRNAKVRRSVVRRFLEFAGKPIDEITPEDVEAYKSHLEATGYAASTIYQRISIISQFFEYAISKALIRYNPVPKGRWRNSFRPKPYSSEKVKALTPQDVKKFLEGIDRETGASEVCGILWKNTNLDGDPPTVRTRVKGGEYVTFELTEQATEAIREYLGTAKRRPRGPHALFAPVTKRRKGKSHRDPRRRGRLYQPLDPYYLWKQVKRIAGKVGLDMNVHTFRHTFAQLYHDTGASQPEVQGALGHKSAATTRIYLDKLAPRSAKAGKAVQRAIEGAL